uniref:Uncharacterized protein n=1 Tax=Cannabis sativa TaxID=3483 RepID=A0A803PR31_CANSA
MGQTSNGPRTTLYSQRCGGGLTMCLVVRLLANHSCRDTHPQLGQVSYWALAHGSTTGGCRLKISLLGLSTLRCLEKRVCIPLVTLDDTSQRAQPPKALASSNIVSGVGLLVNLGYVPRGFFLQREAKGRGLPSSFVAPLFISTPDVCSSPRPMVARFVMPP